MNGSSQFVLPERMGGPYARVSGAFVKYVLPTALLLSVGTGGHVTTEWYRQWHSKWMSQSGGCPDSLQTEPSRTAVASIADEIAYVQSTLKMSAREVANTIGVSRQSLYNWKAGAEIKADNATKFANLKRAADVISAAGLNLTGVQLSRNLPGGKSLAENIAAGMDGGSAAASLVSMLQSEAKRRTELAARFAGRKRKGSEDIFPAVFDE
jgi:DNA-binding XRE family transcriptional regulator